MYLYWDSLSIVKFEGDLLIEKQKEIFSSARMYWEWILISFVMWYIFL